MAGEESDIQQAVAQLAESLDFSEEAVVHAHKMEDSSGIVFYRYRQAFADDAKPSNVDVCGRAEEGWRNATAAIAALETAREAIREFVKEIAPALKLTGSSQERSSPSGEKLLDTSRRPRSIRASMKQGARVSSDMGDLVKSGMKVAENLTLAPPTPPHVTGAETCFPHFQSGGTPSPTGIAPQEMVGTIALTFAVGIKAGIFTVDRIRLGARKLFH